LSWGFKNAKVLVAPLSSQFAALIMVLPIMLLWSPPTHVPSLKAIGAIATLGIVGTAVAYLLYFWLIRHMGPVRASLVNYLLPATSLIWGILLLGEKVTWNAFVGLLLILLGILIVNGTLKAWGSDLLRLITAALASLHSSITFSGNARNRNYSLLTEEEKLSSR